MRLDLLKKERWFLDLPDMEKLKILQLEVDSPLVHTLAGIYDGNVQMPSDQEWLLLSESVKAHDQQINTLLGVLTGPNGTGGINGDIKDMKGMLSNITDIFHKLDKSQDLLKADNSSEHEKMKSDIDGIGRKASRAAEKADRIENDFETYRKEQINVEEQKINKKKSRSFEWYHAVLGLIGLVLVGLQLFMMVG